MDERPCGSSPGGRGSGPAAAPGVHERCTFAFLSGPEAMNFPLPAFGGASSTTPAFTAAMRHLFFDLDGTLTDPATGIIASFRHALDALAGPRCSDAELRRFIGPPLRESFGEILGTEDSEVIELAVRHYRERYSSRGLFENEVYPGVTEALTELGHGGFRMWVVTSKPTVYAIPILEHFGLWPHFSVVYGAELSGEHSTKAELIGKALRCEQIHPSQVCMIGDREHDVHGARAHPGLLSLGVLWGYGSRGELETAGADVLVESIEALPAMVRRLTD